MIRFALFGFLVLCATAVAEDKKDVPKAELARFQGTWKVIDVMTDGDPEQNETLSRLRLTFEGEKLTVAQKDKTESASCALDPKPNPAEITLTTTKGDKVAAIYKFDKDGKLTVSFLKSKGAARPKAFDDKEAVTLVLEKVKEPNK